MEYCHEITRKENFLRLIEKVEHWSFKKNEDCDRTEEFSGIIRDTPEYVRLKISSRKISHFSSEKEYYISIYYSPNKENGEVAITCPRDCSEDVFSMASKYFSNNVIAESEKGLSLINKILEE